MSVVGAKKHGEACGADSVLQLLSEGKTKTGRTNMDNGSTVTDVAKDHLVQKRIDTVCEVDSWWRKYWVVRTFGVWIDPVLAQVDKDVGSGIFARCLWS